MRRVLASIVLWAALALLGGSSPQRDDPDFRARALQIAIVPVSASGVAARAPFRLIGVWRLTSSDSSFGGISALAIHGRDWLALSDAGILTSFRPDFAARRGTGMARGIPPGCGLDGQKTSRDSESLALDPVNGSAWIGFEWRNAVCRMSADPGMAATLNRPLAMRQWPKTGGAEAMTRLADGRFVAIAERPRDNGPLSPMLVFDRDPVDPQARVRQYRFRPPDGYRPTDVAQLPDDDLLVLTRRYRPPFGFSGRAVVVSKAALASGKTITGREAIRIGSPLDENFEAVAISLRGGRSYIWLISDDNFMPFQRTLLILLEYRRR